MELKIGEPLSGDYPLERIAPEDLGQFMSLDTYDGNDPYSEGFYENIFAYYPDNIRVIRDQTGKLAGLIYVLAMGIETEGNEENPYGEIASIFVSDSLRGKGLGEKLLHFGVERLIEKGVPRIQLHTAADNFAMKSLAEKAGFRTAEVIPNYYESLGKDALRMELSTPLQPK
ncbi:MAG: N-acetyltransferase [Candidatus Daviesbacteria bacterium]|nr:N-acetyltransferase [Candidatus Daviesbacteria bacterium]